ncbi:hypothetical protein DFQ01_103188 [Paenibacillus cellulosilyticus]|uniref:Uncharacterized protein n=1 Tax=Paenibacillus cellulosilyticus TaxID=375489 RepID=A0A2V2YXX2_9BACL|nr:hypothetical protein DFQ01_103188 [Paenibacillus cellulosilyticus]
MIHTWWWQAIGTLSFLAVIVGGFLNMFEIRTVVVKKEKSPAANWTLGNTAYRNYNTNRHNQQWRKSS